MNKMDYYAAQGFSPQQLREIQLGLEHGVDVHMYDDPRFTWFQMEQIRLGLESGIDVSVYAQPNIPVDEMEHIREKITQNRGILEKDEADIKRKKLINVLIASALIVLIISVAATVYYFKDIYFLKVQDLQLELKDSVTLEYGSPFYPENYVLNYTESAQLIFPKNLDTEKLGTMQVEYQLTNGEKTITQYLTVKVIDTTAPEINLTAAEIWDYTDTNYQAMIKSAVDMVDGDLSNQVEIMFRTLEDGDRVAEYTVSDRSGNSASESLLMKKIPECGRNAAWNRDKEDCECNSGYTGDAWKGCRVISVPAPTESSEASSNKDSSSSESSWSVEYVEESTVEINTSTEIYGVIPNE